MITVISHDGLLLLVSPDGRHLAVPPAQLAPTLAQLLAHTRRRLAQRGQPRPRCPWNDLPPDVRAGRRPGWHRRGRGGRGKAGQ